LRIVEETTLLVAQFEIRNAKGFETIAEVSMLRR